MRDPLPHTLTPDASSSPLSPVPFTSTKPSPPWQARAEERPNIQHPLSWVCVGEKGGAALGKLIFLLMNLVALHIPGQALQAPGKGRADQGCPALSVGQLTQGHHPGASLRPSRTAPAEAPGLSHRPQAWALGPSRVSALKFTWEAGPPLPSAASPGR